MFFKSEWSRWLFSSGKSPAFDAVTLVRAVAITLVVCGHFRLVNYGGGGAFTLMMLAGYSYSRYILSKVTPDNSPNQRHFLLMLKIAIPAIVFIFAQQFFNKDPMNWPAVALFSNFVKPTTRAAWFIEVYIQINLVMFVIAQTRFGRNILMKVKKFWGAALFFGTLFLVSAVSGEIWDTLSLYHRVPQEMFWFFGGGMLLAAASNAGERLAFAAIVLAAIYMAPIDVARPFFMGAVLFLAIFDTVKPLAFAALVVNTIAGASLMIYLTQFLTGSIVHKLIPSSHAVSMVVAALLVGIVLQKIYIMLWKRAVAQFVSAPGKELACSRKA